MLTIEKLDDYIFKCMCGFAFCSCINGYVADQFTGVALFLEIIRLAKTKPVVSIPKEYSRAILCFIGIFFLFIFFSDEMVKAAKEYWRYINRMIPLLLIILFVHERKKLFCLFFYVLGSMFINNLYGILSIINDDKYIRINGFMDIINFAGCLLIYLPVTLILGLEYRKNKKAVCFFDLININRVYY